MNINEEKYKIKEILPSLARVGDFIRDHNIYYEIIDITCDFSLYHITYRIPIEFPHPVWQEHALGNLIAYAHTPIKIKRLSLKKVFEKL